jgi:hypothetical protein
VLLDDVTDFKVEVLREIKAELEWSDTIPDVELPHAIAVIITTEAFGVIRREFRVKV